MCQVAKPVPWKTILLASSQVSFFWGWGWSGRWGLSFNYVYSFPFIPQTLPTSLLSFKSMASFFTNGYCMNIWTYMYFSKCNTLSPYNATCTYASRAEPGALQWLACSSLGKVTSQNLSIPRLLYSSLCRAEALWVFPRWSSASPSMSPFFSPCLGRHFGGTFWYY